MKLQKVKLSQDIIERNKLTKCGDFHAIQVNSAGHYLLFYREQGNPTTYYHYVIPQRPCDIVEQDDGCKERQDARSFSWPVEVTPKTITINF